MTGTPFHQLYSGGKLNSSWRLCNVGELRPQGSRHKSIKGRVIVSPSVVWLCRRLSKRSFVPRNGDGEEGALLAQKSKGPTNDRKTPPVRHHFYHSDRKEAFPSCQQKPLRLVRVKSKQEGGSQQVRWREMVPPIEQKALVGPIVT